MADRDTYTGYGEPSGRYAERGHFDRDRDDRGRFGNDRYGSDRYGNDRYGSDRSSRDRDTSIFGSRDREHERGADRGWGRDRDDDRGIFERAGDQVRSWFGDDDDDDRRRDRGDDRGYGRDDGRRAGRMTADQDRYRGYGRGDRQPWGGDRDRGDFGREYSTGRYGSGGGAMGGNRGYRGNDEGGRMGAGYGSGGGYGATRALGDHPHDHHYDEWRRQQMAELDRDYDEYRNESRQRFHSEFGQWRNQRQQQRQHLGRVREHMDVVGSDGEHVGTVDKVSGDRIILTKNDPAAGGHHHSIPCSWITGVDDKVTIDKTAEQAKEQWRDEENRRALFEPEENRSNDGPHILDRSFSGTYEKR